MIKLKKLIPLFLGLTLASCSSSGAYPIEYDDSPMDLPWTDYTIPIRDVSFEDNEVTINKGQTKTLEYTLSPSNATKNGLSWSSQNPEIASVEDGVITAIAGGQTNIIVSPASEEHTFKSKSVAVNVVVPFESFDILQKQEGLELDYNESFMFNPTFVPADTTDKVLTYEEIGELDLIDINGSTITAKEISGNTTVRVTHKTSNQVIDVPVSVIDKTVHVSSVIVSLDDNEIEIGKSTAAHATVNPPDAKYAAEVTYSSSKPTVATISESGAIVAVSAGVTQISATCEGVTSAPIELTVFEVLATSIEFANHDVIELDNVTVPSKDLPALKYTVNKSGYLEPSRKNVTYSSSNDAVTVSDKGVVTAKASGNAVITVSIVGENNEVFEDTITVNVTWKAKTLVLNAESSIYEGATTTATVTLDQKFEDLTDNTVHYTVSSVPEGIFTSSVASNKLEITSTGGLGTITVIASNSGLSQTKTINVVEKPVEFDKSKIYLMGSSSFVDGVSTGGSSSWENPKLSYAIDTPKETTEEHVAEQYYARVTFRKNDSWKLYFGHGEYLYTYWDNENRYHKESDTNDAFGLGKMHVDNSDNDNLVVDEAGEYDIYIKHYDGDYYKPFWYQVYVSPAPLFTIDKSSIEIGVAAEGSIKASNWRGSLNVYSSDESIATVAPVDGNGNHKVIGVAPGTAYIHFVDSQKDLVCTVTVKEGAVEARKDIYLNMNGKFDADGAVAFVHTYVTAEDFEDHAMTKVEGQDIIYKANVKDSHDKAVFVREKAGSTELVWSGDNYLNQSGEITWDNTNMFTMTGYDNGYIVGTTSNYDSTIHYEVPEEPVVYNEITLYLKHWNENYDGWEGGWPVIWAWGEGVDGHLYTATKIEGYITYKFSVPQGVTHFKVYRMADGYDMSDYDYTKAPTSDTGMWNESQEVSIHVGDDNIYRWNCKFDNNNFYFWGA